ncbi:MAG: HPF/RaiA family ribosome-associated protein [Bacteroidota bacterium]
MKMIIQTPHFTPTVALDNFVKEKVNGLSHLYDRIETANIILRLEKSGSGEDKVFEIRLGIPGNDLFIKKHSTSFEEATTQAVDALYEQIEKMKPKLQQH